MKNIKTIVIDDDPTGCQTIHGIEVLLSWTENSIREALIRNNSLFLITNSRSMHERDAIQINKNIIRLLKKIDPGFNFRIISRGDSTLRGYVFEEIKAILDETMFYDGVAFCPFFMEGGRLTKNNIHYVVQNGVETPAHETEFANDPDFPFSTSYLPEYLEEKSKGFWKSDQVMSISLELIRNEKEQGIFELLKDVSNMQPIVVNAEYYNDMDTVVKGIKMVEQSGKKLLFRTGASFVKSVTETENIPLYSPSERFKSGVVIVGSFVNKTTLQIEKLVELDFAQPVVVEVDKIENEGNVYLNEISNKINEILDNQELPVIYTERNFKKLKKSPPETISNFLCDAISGIKEQVDFVVAKGGITSFDVAKKALKLESALVRGQVLKGVPVWEVPDNNKVVKHLYVVFPGNVGDEESLLEVVSKVTEID